MNKLLSYMEGKSLMFKVIIGRKTFKGYDTPLEALVAGVDVAQREDPRSSELLYGKPFDHQVGIIFGQEIREQYFSGAKQ